MRLPIDPDSVKGFLDPAVQFGLQFESVPANRATKPREVPPVPPPPADAPEAEAPAPDSDAQAGGPKIVSLDSFRKK